MTPVTPTERARNPRGQGDRLRTDLISSALDLLAETGDPDQVSIRAVAKAAGVSATAAYRHFDDRDALIEAACDACFGEFADRMLAATGGVADPFDRLAAAGAAYLAYARAEHGHYRVLFSNPLVTKPDHDDFPTDGDAAGTAFQQLVTIVTECLEAGARPTIEGDALYLSFHIWTWIHGIVDLASTHPALPWPDLSRMFADSQRALGLDRPAT